MTAFGDAIVKPVATNVAAVANSGQQLGGHAADAIKSTTSAMESSVGHVTKAADNIVDSGTGMVTDVTKAAGKTLEEVQGVEPLVCGGW